jgi:hypothetical protein
MKYLIITTLILLSGCAIFQEKPAVEKVVYVSTPLTLPPRPVLPTFSYDDIGCLSDEIATKVADRDLMRKQYTEQLETIIRSTQK